MTEKIKGSHYRAKHDSALLEYLHELFPEKSRSGIKQLLTRNMVYVNGRQQKHFMYMLKTGDDIFIVKAKRAVTAMHGIRILYEDESLIAIDKPSGMPCISTGKDNVLTAYSILASHVKAEDPGKRIFIVHRIDRDTSGVLLFAKDERSKRLLQDNWNEVVLERKYIAVTEGRPQQDSGTITSWLKENPKSLKVHSSPVDNGGKKAVTHYRVLKTSGAFSLVEFELETGRKNQIRVHASDTGFPIAGDRKYGSSWNPAGRLALHAATLVFTHPATGKTVTLSSPVPNEFTGLFEN